jgi:tetratricopeptide (TPR) repeat protein
VQQPVPDPKPASKNVLKQPPRISEKIEKRKKKVVKVRTDRKGPAAAIFNQAMQALEKDEMERAIEFYCRSIIAERDLLAEPENGIIKKGLEYLQERPNRMPHGQFFRGFFIAVAGNLELASPDLKAYISRAENKKETDSLFLKEAIRLVERYEAIKAQKEAQAALLAEEETQRQAEIDAMTKQAAVAEPEQPRASDFVVKRMAVDEVLAEADRLTRSGRQKEAIAVLKVGLESEPDNLQLLMKSANAYTELLIMKGDQEAGKMALLQFEKIAARAPENSREWGVAQEMIEELKNRLR